MMTPLISHLCYYSHDSDRTTPPAPSIRFPHVLLPTPRPSLYPLPKKIPTYVFPLLFVYE